MYDSLVSRVREGSEFTFDYFIMIVVAGWLAGCGLASNNVVVIVASMLVSPLMGPIMGITFGIIIKDWKMFCTGLISELAGLTLCIIVGFIVTFVFGQYGEVWDWPNTEMEEIIIEINQTYFNF